jgi:putative Mn2+ efflux pump MntP
MGLLIGAFLISLAHAVMPTHWLTFLLVAKVHHWRRAKLLFITAFAGACHILSTLILGLIVWLVGRSVMMFFSSAAKTVSAILILLVGIAYIFAAWRTTQGEEAHKMKIAKFDAKILRGVERGAKSEWLSVGALLLSLTLSPCEAVMPLFFAASASGGYHTLVMLVVITSVTTIIGMVGMVALSSLGIEHIRLELSEKVEMMLVGVLFIILALAMLH